MQIAGVSLWNGLAERLTPQRLAAVAAVIVLHIIVLLLLLEAGVIRVPPLLPIKETTIWLQPQAPGKKPPRPQTQPQPTIIAPQPLPSLEEFLRRLNAALSNLPPMARPPEPVYNGLRAFGEYMFNCSGAYYGRLTRQELDQCLGQYLPNHRNETGTLGVQADSVWKRQRDQAREPQAPIEGPCPIGSFNANNNIPCYSFSNGSAKGVMGPIVSPTHQ